ncbi:MAG: (5-formylfuran-3-yl)methyl phosphate synthase [Planctomycetaceae bacterium]
MRLLVSVRNLKEARVAVDAGVDIVDLKEPDAGALGMVNPSVIAEVSQSLECDEHEHRPGLSIALGEVADWHRHDLPGFPEVMYAKLGLAGLRDEANWENHWLMARSRIEQNMPQLPNWVAVCYADHNEALAPSPESVLEAARKTGCQFLLFDTWNKQNGRLWDHLSPGCLATLVERAHQYNLQVAVAGRLNADDIPLAAEVGADIFAVRSAACEQHKRTGFVSARCIEQLRKSIVDEASRS